ncbi:Alcohol dehydrogenase [Pseudodesulfovibrio hydrargyri]|uniref:Alcohol dehydrogenase n=1 Tax=Pseudodesulfovibrio hydrargyri TaxID=2125990 RepID=A0A1J5MSY9_9BACT|nr:zinc-binding dehydrogenase [Pseudodesulfovibrio hydrargyri]OIQ49114.1 Alcohol dehydrogenase [Pseudodesulfovibrio hydrargyri]
MFAVYCEKPDNENPLAALVVGERPEPVVPDGWVRVRVTHASLNRHDIFTLRGITGQDTPIPFPMILGNDASGVLDDGTPVVLYPLITGPDRAGDETLDLGWHVLSEKAQGTFADHVVVPRRNALPLPDGLSPLHASVMGTAWLTAYRMLATKSGLRLGQTMLVQGATGGVSTALIQLGRASGMEVWATSRDARGLDLATGLGAHRGFLSGEPLPRKADAVFDSVGKATWAHSLASVKRGGTVVAMGMTTGRRVEMDLLPVIVNQLTVAGTIMGTLEEMRDLLGLVVGASIVPQIGDVLPMERAGEGVRTMVEGRTRGKIVFTR